MTSPYPPAPLDQPQYGATFRQGASRLFRKYASFSGRASQSELWWGLLVTTVLTTIAAVPYLIATVAFVIDTFRLTSYSIANGPTPRQGLESTFALLLSAIPMVVVSWALLVPTYALLARRLHDVGWSGWMCLLQSPTGGIWAYVVGFLPAKAEGLRYERPGSTPLLTPEVAAQVSAMQASAMAYAYGAQPPYGPPHPPGAQPAQPQG